MTVPTPTEVYPGVVIDPRVVHGVPVLKGTRVPVQVILGHLAAGEDVVSIQAAYAVSLEQVRAALGYAANRLAYETVLAVVNE